jgi:XTP/dITP diphosphohydrolase
VSRRILLATRSRHKAAEIQRILSPTSRFELITLRDLGMEESPEEDELEKELTFAGNARAKAEYFARRSSLETLADDSGLEVFALGLAPGVRTRRFALDAGRTDLQGDALDAANNELLLESMRSVPSGQRGARYVCACTLARPAGDSITAIGTCSGEIATAPRGTAGFGYDPLFYLPDLGLTFAELTPEQKDARSHRARACRSLASLIH